MSRACEYSKICYAADGQAVNKAAEYVERIFCEITRKPRDTEKVMLIWHDWDRERRKGKQALSFSDLHGYAMDLKHGIKKRGEQ
jgi:hypothetical protein